MPGPYEGTLAQNVNDVDYNGTRYRAGDSFEFMTACETLGFINAVAQANPDKGFSEDHQRVIDQLVEECPATPSDAAPIDAPPGVPSESSQVFSEGGDSGVQQGAPTPPVAGSVGGGGEQENPNPTEEPTRPPTGEPHPTHGGEQPQVQTQAGEPVDIFNGAFYINETDLTIPNTILPLSFTRVYRSGAASFGPFGWNWDHNFNVFLRELNTGNIAVWRNLHEDIFRFDGAGFEPPRGVFEKLDRVSSLSQVFEISEEGGNILRFERPSGWIDGERIPLLWIRDRHGNMLRFTYGAEDKLHEVRDDDDRFFRFHYDQCGLLVSMEDQAGRKFDYEHDEQTMQLTCVKSPAIDGHPDGIVKIYHYENPWAFPQLRHNIVRVQDAKGNVYLENIYEQDPASWSFARIKEQYYGGYLYQYQYTQLQWVPSNGIYANIPAVRVEVMNPDFGVETYTFNYRGDLLDQRQRLVKDKSFRVVAWLYEFDEQGNLTKLTRPDGSQMINTYDFNNPDPRMRGKMLRKELTAASGFPSPSRIIWRGSYEPTYQLLIEEKNETNITTTYRYDFQLTPGAPNNTGKLKQIIHPNATLPNGSTQTASTFFEHNAKGQPTATILPDGVRHEFEYGIMGNEKSRLVRQIFDAANLHIEQQLVYDTFGYNRERIDGNGHMHVQFYNALGLIDKSILPPVNGITAEYINHYDGDKKLVSFERPRGNFTDAVITSSHIHDQFEREVLGFPIKFTFSSNTSEARVLTLKNDFRGFPIEMINPDGSKVRRTFDERGLLLTEEIIGTDDIKISSKKTYDRSGKLIQDTDPYGLITKYEYEGFSRIHKVILPNGTEIRSKWLPNDLLESEETFGNDGQGAIRQLAFSKFAYDEKNRMVSQTVKSFIDNPLVSVDLTTTYFYDESDRLVKTVNSRGAEAFRQYDGLGRLLVETDFMGNEIHYSYDNNDNLIRQENHHVEPDGSVSVISQTFTYDERNRRIAFVETDGTAYIREYDDRNLLVRESDYLGVVKEMAYTSFHEKFHEVQDVAGLNITHQWTINNMSRPVVYIDPMGQVSNYLYDSVGRNYRIDYPNGFSSKKTFNELNQVVKETLGSGVEFEYVYDAFNRIQTIKNSALPSPVIKVEDHHFQYDGLDRMVSAQLGTSLVQRRYDSRSRLIAETNFGNTILCNYNDVAGQAEKIWPDGRTERLSFDFNGTLNTIEETTAGTLGSGINLIASLKSSGPDALGEATYHSGTNVRNAYDERKRLTEMSIQSPGGTNEQVKYRYNAGNIKQVEALLGHNPKLSYFEFDQKSRLINAKDTFASPIPDATTQAEHNLVIDLVRTASATAAHEEGFSYDASDARTLYSETGNPDRNYTYLPGHKIQNDGFNNYTYHTDGALQSDGIFTYEADALGRIVKVNSGATALLEITYDALGRPAIVKESGRPDKSYIYLGDFVSQINENNIAARQITQNPVTGSPLASHSVSGTHYTIFDGRFNLIGLLDTNGALVESYRYQTFGSPQIFDSSGTAIGNSAFGIEPVFGGMPYLPSVNLYASKRRLMNPVNGVWLSADPRGYTDSSSLYVYVRQNPIDYVDPEGELAFLGVLAVMAVGAVVGGGINAVRQGIAISEGSQEGWEWGQFGLSVGLGAVAAPILVVAPELAVPLAAWGVAGGIDQMSRGNYATGAFDVVASIAPFGFKGPRNATFGPGTRYGQSRGLGESASWGQRFGRFDTIGNNVSNYVPNFGGRRIGVGFAPTRGGGPEGHVSVVFEEGPGVGTRFFEKNGQRINGELWAAFNEQQTLPEFYFPENYGPTRPFSYEWVNIPRWNWSRALGYGSKRTSGAEPFNFDGANCSNFVGDVLSHGGINGIAENSSAGALARNFGAFARNWPNLVGSGYAAPFYTSGIQIPEAQAADKK